MPGGYHQARCHPLRRTAERYGARYGVARGVESGAYNYCMYCMYFIENRVEVAADGLPFLSGTFLRRAADHRYLNYINLVRAGRAPEIGPGDPPCGSKPAHAPFSTCFSFFFFFFFFFFFLVPLSSFKLFLYFRFCISDF
jgi:hypothetical protein